MKKDRRFEKLQTEFIAVKNKNKELGVRLWNYRNRINELLDKNDRLKEEVRQLRKKLQSDIDR